VKQVETGVGAAPFPATASAGGDPRRLIDGIQLLVRRFSISERADVSCCGLTVAQAATLDALRAGGPLRQGALGRRLGVTASTLTRNLDRLEESGLVEREPDPEDSRAARVGLTRAGHAAAAQVERQEEAFARSILDRLPAGRREEVLASLEHLLVAVRQATEHCCPGAYDHLSCAIPRAEARKGGRDGESCCD
jgi:DNA-binding MarR family transcriptional regulator